MKTLVTGATGLIGSNICQKFAQAGSDVRALVRDPSGAAWLTALGAEVVQGDITKEASVVAAAAGCDWIVHCAALVPGGPAPNTFEQYESVNVAGTRHILDAATDARIIVMNTSGAFDRSQTIHEGSAEVPDPVTDPYALTKRSAHRLVCERLATGADIITVLPPATIGSAPSGPRAALPPGFNSRMLMATRGKISEFPEMPISVGLASDVARACVSAMQQGITGRVYLPWGDPEDLVSVNEFLNMTCVAAGVPHRVKGLSRSDLQRPEILRRWGPAIVRSAMTVPDPYFRNDVTVHELDYGPTPLSTAIEETVKFLLSL